MPIAHSYLFKNCFEFISRSEISSIPGLVRGIYVLYKEEPQRRGVRSKMNVVYVGMARGEKSGAKGRLKSHNTHKADWTHFSVFEVWDNIYPQQIQELEGLFRHLYRRDSTANKLNRQKGYKPLHILAKQTKGSTK